MSKRSVNVLRKMAIPYLFSQPQTFTGAVTHDAAVTTNSTVTNTGEVTNKGVTKQAAEAGSYHNGATTVVSKVVAFSASPNIDSGAISLPGDALLTKLTVVCDTAASCGSGGNITVQWGTTAGGTDYAAAVVFETGTSVNGGVGTSSDTALATALTADNAIVQQPNTSCWISGAAELHGRVIHAGGNWTGGSFTFIAEFVYAGGN